MQEMPNANKLVTPATEPELEKPALPQIILDARINDEAIAPAQDREAFLFYFSKLPPQFQQTYATRLQAVLKSRDEASTVTALRGATFEMSRIAAIVEQGFEKIDVAPPTIKLDYLGYDKKDPPDTTAAPSRVIKDAGIEFDVPIKRDGLSYAYETKSYPRMKYGSDIKAKNQVLKYQAAIDKGLLAGATVELRGRLDHQFLVWAAGATAEDAGRAPAVEMIYTINLPSGTEYRFVLKPVKGREGLRFNDEHSYDENDRQAIDAIGRAVADKSIFSLITETGVNPEEASEELRPLLGNPMTITTRKLFDEYDSLRTKGLSKALSEKVAYYRQIDAV